MNHGIAHGLHGDILDQPPVRSSGSASNPTHSNAVSLPLSPAMRAASRCSSGAISGRAGTALEPAASVGGDSGWAGVRLEIRLRALRLPRAFGHRGGA